MDNDVKTAKWGNWFLRYLDKVDCECVMELTTSCNFHCEYCSNGRGREEDTVVRRGQTPEDIQAIVDFFDAHKTWHIVVGGGEASTHPLFYDLIEKLTIKHYISIYTNLSLDLDRLFQRVSPEKIVSVRCTLHAPYSEDNFFKKIERLKDADFNPAMVKVATPESVGEIDRIAKRCLDLDIPLSVFPLAGPYRNKIYPRDYDQETRDFLIQRPSLVLYPGHLVRLLSHKEALVTAGFQCSAGARFFSIHAETGMINRCEGVHHQIGNIYTGEFSPLDSDTECPSTCCIDYCFSDTLADRYFKEFFATPLSDSEMLEKAKIFADESMQRLDDIRKTTTQKADVLLQGRRTLLWGAGMAGSAFLQAYSDSYSTDHIVGFVDINKERWGITIHGKQVFSPQEIKTINPDIILICAPAFENEILEMVSHFINESTQVFGLNRDITQSQGYGF